MTTPRSLLSAALVAGLLAATGCTTNGDGEAAETRLEPDPRRGAEVDRVCFTRSISNFSDTTRRSVVIEARVNDYYQIETFGPCFNLDDALSLAINTTGSCLTRGDELFASESVFGFRDHSGIGPQRCVVRKIFEWNPDALEESEEEAEEDETEGETET